MTKAVPAHVYAAASRIWIGSPGPLDDDVVRHWCRGRWRVILPPGPVALAYWVMSIAVQDGHQ